jgi:hypothetical protein
MPQAGSVRGRQRGWAAVFTLLFALLIVAVMAGILLKQQGPPPASASRAGPGAGAPGAANVDAEGTSNPMERARALEKTVQQQAADHDKRIDEAAK